MIFNKQYFEKVFAKGDAWGYSVSEYERTKYLRQLEAIKRYASEPKNILEIGCAEGTHTAMIARAFPGAKILGIDISQRAIERAKENCNGCGCVELIEADIVRMIGQGQLPQNTFDVVIQSESLYYMFPGLLLKRGLVNYLRALTVALKINGLFVTSNGINILTRGVMGIYYEVMKKYSVPVYSGEYREWNEFRNQYVTYDIRLFQKIPVKK